MTIHSSPATPTTSSTGVYVFEVPSYSFHRCLAAGCFLRSDTFRVAEFAWSVCFHPGGDARLPDSGDHAAVSLELMTTGAVVEVSFDMALVDAVTGARWLGAESEKAELDTCAADGFCRWCLSRFMKRSELEASPFLHRDRVVIECALTVLNGGPAVPELVLTNNNLPDCIPRENAAMCHTLCSGTEKLADLRGCSPRERAAILYIQSLCSSKETSTKVVFKSHRGFVAAASMRCLTIPSAFDGPDKYISPDVSIL